MTCNENNTNSSFGFTTRLGVFYSMTDIPQRAEQLRNCLVNPALLVWIGVDDEEMLVSYAKAPHPLGHQMIVIEQSEALFLAMKARSNAGGIFENPGISWIVGNHLTDISRKLHSIFLRRDVLKLLERIQVCRMPTNDSHRSLFAESVNQLIGPIAQGILQGFESRPFSSLNSIRHALVNLRTIDGLPHLNSLKGIFSGLPGIVVAAGPSLDASIHALKNNNKRAIIISCGAVSKKLLDNGITPHATMLVDERLETKDQFEYISSAENMCLFTHPFVHPAALNSYKGPKAVFTLKSHDTGWLFPSEPEQFWGSSVVHNAACLLNYLGCSPLYFFGLDLAFSRFSDEAYVSGSRGISNSERIDVCQVEGNNGKPIASRTDFVRFANFFAELIEMHGMSCVNVIDSEYGQKISGMSSCHPDSLSLPDQSGLLEFGDIMRVIRESIPLKIDPYRIQRVKNSLDDYICGAHRLIGRVESKELLSYSDSCEAEWNLFISELEQEYSKLHDDPAGIYRTIVEPAILTKALYFERAMINAADERYNQHGQSIIWNLWYERLATNTAWARLIRSLFDERLTVPEN